MGEQLNLGELIALLKKRPGDGIVTYDFCRFIPGKVDSFRGYYDQLAIGWSEPTWESKSVRADELLATLSASVGKTFDGYKGGEYRMDARTRMWVANYGESSDTAIVGVEADGDGTILLTGLA